MFSEKLNKVFKDNVIGSQVVIYKNKEIIEYNYGFASIESNKLVDDDTIFRIASISKIIVAMSAMKLVEEGRLDLDADLSDIFGFKIRNPQFPDVPITTKMLMLHTSSINDGYDDEKPEFDNIEKGYNGVNGRGYFVDLADLLAEKNSKYYSENTYLNYKPGSKFTYSNFGTGILACVVEKCSGELFTDYVEKNILKPLNLDASFRACDIEKKDKISDTFYYLDKTNEFRTARTGKSFVENSYPKFAVGHNFRGPAGGLFISMSDLSKIMQVLINDGAYENVVILKKDTVDLMLQMHYLGPDLNYLAKGLQLKFIDGDSDLLLKGHTGSAYGVSSFMYFSKEDNIGICFIANGGKYKAKVPGLNNIQAGVLDVFVEEFYEKKNKTVKFNINNNYAYLNDRKILLHSLVLKNEDVYLNLIDIANILNIIPRITEDKVIIKGNEVRIENGLINLFKLLVELNIEYAKVLDNYEIYL